MKPSELLIKHRSDILALTSQYPVANPRVFGSVVHGTDEEGSDLDILVDSLPNTNLFHLGGLQDGLETLLGISVDLVTPFDLPASFRADVLNEARPI